MGRASLLFPLLALIFLTASATTTTQAPPSGPRVGGWSPIKDVLDPEVQDVAKFAVSQHNKNAGTNLALVSVLSGESQVVSGMNYKLLIKASDGHTYEAVVFDQSWTKTRKLTSFTLKQPAVTATTKKPPTFAAKVGGWNPIKDVADPTFQDVAKFAVAEHNKASGTSLALVAVVSGETQVVSGMNYKLLIKASDGITYEAVVYDQPWTKTRKLTSFTLKGSAATAKPGGWSPIKDVAAPQVQDIAKFAVAEHNKDAGTNLALVAVLSGETQVVAGLNYRLVIKASDGHTYLAVVWDKAGQKVRKLTSFTLNN